MPTYVIVDKDKDPLGPQELRAGDTIQVSQGDVFFIAPSVQDTIKFASADGSKVQFDVQFIQSNLNSFDIEVLEDLSPTLTMAEGVDLPAVNIKAEKSDAVNLTTQDNVSLGAIEGSALGADVLTLGDGFTTDQDIKLYGGDTTVTIGDFVVLDKLITGPGTDNISIGIGLIANEIQTGLGNDVVTIGDDATLHRIETG